MVKAVKFFDKLEDKTRGRLSRVPITYALIGGIAIVLFWRGIWDLADTLASQGGWLSFVFHPMISLLLSVIILLGSGLFVSFFIGDRIILSGLKHEKKVEEKTEAEVREEEAMLTALHTKLDHLTREVEELKSSLLKK
ncbi:MAG: hypothetical protein Q7R65_03740 [bacterium]|nr:hypothetical protein [bacterium]